MRAEQKMQRAASLRAGLVRHKSTSMTNVNVTTKVEQKKKSGGGMLATIKHFVTPKSSKGKLSLGGLMRMRGIHEESHQEKELDKTTISTSTMDDDQGNHTAKRPGMTSRRSSSVPDLAAVAAKELPPMFQPPPPTPNPNSKFRNTRNRLARRQQQLQGQKQQLNESRKQHHHHAPKQQQQRRVPRADSTGDSTCASTDTSTSPIKNGMEETTPPANATSKAVESLAASLPMALPFDNEPETTPPTPPTDPAPAQEDEAGDPSPVPPSTTRAKKKPTRSASNPKTINKSQTDSTASASETLRAKGQERMKRTKKTTASTTKGKSSSSSSPSIDNAGIVRRTRSRHGTLSKAHSDAKLIVGAGRPSNDATTTIATSTDHKKRATSVERKKIQPGNDCGDKHTRRLALGNGKSKSSRRLQASLKAKEQPSSNEMLQLLASPLVSSANRKPTLATIEAVAALPVAA